MNLIELISKLIDWLIPPSKGADKSKTVKNTSKNEINGNDNYIDNSIKVEQYFTINQEEVLGDEKFEQSSQTRPTPIDYLNSPEGQNYGFACAIGFVLMAFLVLYGNAYDYFMYFFTAYLTLTIMVGVHRYKAFCKYKP